MKWHSLRNYNLNGKTVLVRVDYNVPLERGQVSDNHRIKATLPTIELLLAQNCKVILATHLGRPEGRIVPELRLNPVVMELQTLLPKRKIIKFDDCIGKEIKAVIQKSPGGTLFMLENLRFYKEEEQDHPIFTHALAHLAEVYVNDAFAVSHRHHASIQGITEFLPSLAGLSLEKEVENLSHALHPERPAIWILGGAKLDKINLVQQALRKADRILIGGAVAFSFLRAKKIPVGISKVDPHSVETALQVLRQRRSRKIVLPIDFVVAESFSPTAKTKIVKYNQLQNNHIGLDLGPETIALFKKYLYQARTIVWNGPLGYYEWAAFSTATKEIGRFIGSLTATSIAGGGETAEALHKFHLDHRLTNVSTGGGAALEFLAGKKLPGLTALERNYKLFRL